MDAADEHDLLMAARAGDEKAFGRLATCHGPGLERFCLLMLGCPHRAHQAVCETLLRGWCNLDRGAPTMSAQIWLFRLATNVCLEVLDGSDDSESPSPFDGMKTRHR
jgi:DNA-directed RNA polymerase specialized sigma24 family protein